MNFRYPLSSIAALAAAAVLCSCEDNNKTVYVYENPPAFSSSVSASVSGTWSGRSATGQVSSKLYLSETNGKISGTLAWPGDTRSVTGTRNGSSVTLHIGGGDTWKLSFSGDKISGTGYKYGGGTYSCSFSR